MVDPIEVTQKRFSPFPHKLRCNDYRGTQRPLPFPGVLVDPLQGVQLTGHDVNLLVPFCDGPLPLAESPL
jgi:hypothetical protein